MSKQRQRRLNHGSQGKHVKGGRIKGIATAQQAQCAKGRQERGRIGADTEKGQALAEMRLVMVEWVDSYGCSASWQPLGGSAPSALTCRSVGWLLHDADDCKVIVPHVSQGDHAHAEPQGCGDMTIPSAAIVRLVNLPIPPKAATRR